MSAWLLTALLAVAADGAAGQEVSFPAANCALTPPPGWQAREPGTQPGLIAAFSDAEGDRSLLIRARALGQPASRMSKSFTMYFDRDAESSGDRKISGKLVTFCGLEAYERLGTSSGDISTLSLALPTGDGLYLLEARSRRAIVAEDADIRLAMESFRFLHPPAPFPAPRRTAYWFGYYASQVTIILVVLRLIFWAVSKVRSRRTEPARPPPLPPN